MMIEFSKVKNVLAMASLTFISLSANVFADRSIGAGVSTGPAEDSSSGEAVHAFILQYENLGSHPGVDEKLARSYGSKAMRIGLTPPFLQQGKGASYIGDFSVEGMGGWQILGAKKDGAAFHLGAEPLNFAVAVNTNIFQDIKNHVQNIKNYVTATTPPDKAKSAVPPIKEEQHAYYMPALSAGVEIRGKDCRAIILVRGGAAAGAKLRQNEHQVGLHAFGGPGIMMNCPKFDAGVQWAHVFAFSEPMDMLDASAIYKPLAHLGLGIRGHMFVDGAVDDVKQVVTPTSTILGPVPKAVDKKIEATVKVVF